MTENITPELLLNAYAQGYFPMAQAVDDLELMWFLPERRGIMPLTKAQGLRVSRSNRKLLKYHPYQFTLNQDFRAVMQACRENREGCWISDRIIDLYSELRRLGFAQSLECWRDNQLVGGIYGITLGGVFCGESMFSRESGASKVALYAMISVLRDAGYVLFDVQYVNEHLKQFGVQEISAEAYSKRLEKALNVVPQKLHIREDQDLFADI